ncbi:hypothetical protein MHTCC0001_14130 [Flavobacteriaceae bacterium MHTCC 0001]
MAYRVCKKNKETDVCSSTHGGTDYGTPTGTSITAATSGTVVRSYRSGTFGNCVIVDHGVSNLDSDHVYTLYAHGSSRSVSVGDQVEAGDEVIVSGNTGNSTGPHLHYEIIKTSDSPTGKAFFKGLDKRYGPEELRNIIDKDCN